MFVAFARLSLRIPFSHSLKEKRAVVRKIKDRVKSKHDVRVAEVGGLDTWQSAVLGFAVVSNEQNVAEHAVEVVVRYIENMDVGQLIAADREVLHYGDEGVS